jgi:hypothetical protein
VGVEREIVANGLHVQHGAILQARGIKPSR